MVQYCKAATGPLNIYIFLRAGYEIDRMVLISFQATHDLAEPLNSESTLSFCLGWKTNGQMDLKDVVAQVYFRQGGFGREKMRCPIFFARYWWMWELCGVLIFTFWFIDDVFAKGQKQLISSESLVDEVKVMVICFDRIEVQELVLLWFFSGFLSTGIDFYF